MNAEALAARLVAILLAALGTSTVVVAGHAYDADQLTTAATLVLSGIGLVYGAVRTWRARTVTPRPAGVPVPQSELAQLRRKARERDVIARTGYRASGPSLPTEHDLTGEQLSRPVEELARGTRAIPGWEGDESS